MARLLPTNNAVTNAVPANTPIAFCMTGISCVEWPAPADPGPYGLVRCLAVRIATTAVVAVAHRHHPPRQKLRPGFSWSTWDSDRWAQPADRRGRHAPCLPSGSR